MRYHGKGIFVGNKVNPVKNGLLEIALVVPGIDTNETFAKMAHYMQGCCRFHGVTVIKYLKELDLRVPENLSVVGFDNIKLCTHMAEPLTTIEFSKQIMTDGVVEILENWTASNSKLDSFPPIHKRLCFSK